MQIKSLLNTIPLEFPFDYNWSGPNKWEKITAIFRKAVFDDDLYSREVQGSLIKILQIGRDGPQTPDGLKVEKYAKLLNSLKENIEIHSNLMYESFCNLKNPLESLGQEVLAKDVVTNNTSDLEICQKILNKMKKIFFTQFQLIEKDRERLEEILKQARLAPRPSEKSERFIRKLTELTNKMNSEFKSIKEVIRQLEEDMDLHRTALQMLNPVKNTGLRQPPSVQLNLEFFHTLKTDMLNFMISNRDALNGIESDFLGDRKMEGLVKELQDTVIIKLVSALEEVTALDEITQEAKERNDASILENQQETLLELCENALKKLNEAQQDITELEEKIETLVRNILVQPVYKILGQYQIYDRIIISATPLTGLRLEQKSLRFNLATGRSEELWLKEQRKATQEWIKEQGIILNRLRDSIYQRYLASNDGDKEIILINARDRLLGRSMGFTTVEVADSNTKISQQEAVEKILSSIFYPNKRTADQINRSVPEAKRNFIDFT